MNPQFYFIARKSSAWLLLVSLSGLTSHLQAATSVNLGATLNGSEWNGDNGPGGTSFESSEGGQFGLSASLNIDRFYLGFSLQGGDYSFDGNAPDQFTAQGNATANNTTVQHSDVDLLAGYYVLPRISLFVDLKGVGSKWQNNGYQQNFGGVGVGASGYHKLAEKWLMFGTIGFVGGDVKDSGGAKHGTGRSRAFTLGGVYSMTKNDNLNFGIKLRKYEFDYDSGNQQNYTLNGVFVGYTRTIRW